PLLAKVRVIAAPIPRPPPVTMARRPARSKTWLITSLPARGSHKLWVSSNKIEHSTLRFCSITIIFEYDRRSMTRGSAPLAPEIESAPRRAPAGARHVQILELVGRVGFVSVADIAESFSVSDMTIRRDLVALEGKGMIARTHGGALGVDRREIFDLAE